MWRKYIMTLMVAGLCLGLMGCTHEKFVEFHEDWESFWEMPAIEEEAPPGVEGEEAPPVVEEGEAPPEVEEEEAPAVEVADDDGDGVENSQDNCPALANADQFDADNDGVGDDCDNCRLTANADQADSPDADAIGNECDKWDDIKSTFAIKSWEEIITYPLTLLDPQNPRPENAVVKRSFSFQYKEDGTIEEMKWETSAKIADIEIFAMRCVLLNPSFDEVAPRKYELSANTRPECKYRPFGKIIDFTYDKAEYAIDNDGNYVKAQSKTTEIENKFIKGITQVIRDAEGKATSREYTFESAGVPLLNNSIYEYDEGNVSVWIFNDTAISPPKIIEKRVYTWKNSLLKKEDLAELVISDAGYKPTDVVLAFSLDQNDNPTITETEELFEIVPSTDPPLSVTRIRTIKYDQVQGEVAPIWSGILVDLAKPLLFMSDPLPIPPFKLW